MILLVGWEIVEIGFSSTCFLGVGGEGSDCIMRKFLFAGNGKNVLAGEAGQECAKFFGANVARIGAKHVADVVDVAFFVPEDMEADFDPFDVEVDFFGVFF